MQLFELLRIGGPLIALINTIPNQFNQLRHLPTSLISSLGHQGMRGLEATLPILPQEVLDLGAVVTGSLTLYETSDGLRPPPSRRSIQEIRESPHFYLRVRSS